MIRPCTKGLLPTATIGLLAFMASAPASRAQVAAPPPASPAPAAAPAVEAEPDPAPTFTANVGIFSQYAYRGISQSAGKPALQGGFDFSHPRGAYAGVWGSSISWLADFGAYTRSGVEIDVYGGYKIGLGDSGLVLDLGTIFYGYPGDENPGFYGVNTWEISAGFGWKWASAKYSYNLLDYFGARPTGEETDGTWYLDFSAAYPVGTTGATLVAHFGVLDVANDGGGDLEVSGQDWKLGASWTVPRGLLKGLEIGGFYSGHSTDSAFYVDLTGYDTAKDTGVVYVKKTF